MGFTWDNRSVAAKSLPALGPLLAPVSWFSLAGSWSCLAESKLCQDLTSWSTVITLSGTQLFPSTGADSIDLPSFPLEVWQKKPRSWCTVIHFIVYKYITSVHPYVRNILYSSKYEPISINFFPPER